VEKNEGAMGIPKWCGGVLGCDSLWSGGQEKESPYWCWGERGKREGGTKRVGRGEGRDGSEVRKGKSRVENPNLKSVSNNLSSLWYY
jgi:hypothetical protein